MSEHVPGASATECECAGCRTCVATFFGTEDEWYQKQREENR